VPPSPAAKPSAVNSGRRDEQLEAARLAASSGDWKAARAICLSLLESDPTPPGIFLVQLAISEFMLGSVDRALVAAERAYRAYIGEGMHWLPSRRRGGDLITPVSR
jgi:hypothetical protein